MKKSLIYLFHGLYWLGNVVILFIVMAVLCYNKQIVDTNAVYYFKLIAGLGVVPAVFSFYSFYLWLFPNYLKKNKIRETILFGFAISVSASILGALVLYILLGYDLSCHAESNYFGFFLMCFIAMMYGIVSLIIKGFITWYEEIKIKEDLLNKNHKMELALVKSQLDPHFLFNTINNIDVLILKKPDDASAYLNSLSDIMRFMLFETKTDKIPLSKEIIYITKYIELQKIRSANKLYVTYKVIGDAKDKTIAPMVFIPFIENAFKHCTNKKIQNAINVVIEIKEKSISMQCDNAYNIDRQKTENSNGLGSDLIQKRLDLIYPNQYVLSTKEEGERYFVSLIVDI